MANPFASMQLVGPSPLMTNGDSPTQCLGLEGTWLAVLCGPKSMEHRFWVFLQGTSNHGLLYTHNFEGDHGQSEEKGIHLYSDASFGPPGSRGHQGLMAVYSFALIQWESKQQPFGTLSSSEAELMGYTDALTMGESCATIVAILESGDANEAIDCVLHGDSQSVGRLGMSPELLLLTKPIVSPSSWSRFREFTGLCTEAASINAMEDGSRVKKLIRLVSRLVGVACWQPVQEHARVAKCVTIAAVASSIACLMSKEGVPAPAWTKASRESGVERRENQDGTREDGRDTSPTGSLGRERTRKPWMQQPPKMSALRAPVMHVGLGTDLPRELMRFQTPPTGNDRWECLGVGLGGGEWWVSLEEIESSSFPSASQGHANVY